MNPLSVRLLLLRFVLVPVIALGALVGGLAYSAHRLNLLVKQGDTTDEIMLHGSDLMRLFVDEETGVRGFLLEKKPAMLEPYQQAGPRIDEEFDGLLTLASKDPDLVGQIRNIRELYKTWHAHNVLLVGQAGALIVDRGILDQKQGLDRLRFLIDGFIHNQIALRRQRDSRTHDLDAISGYFRLGAAIVTALLIVWASLAAFERLNYAFTAQLKEVESARARAFEREQWLDVTLRSIGDAVIACDAQGRIVFMNEVAELLTGWSEQEAAQLPLDRVFRIVHETTRILVESPVDKVRRLGTIVGLANHTILIRKDGAEISIDDSGAPIRNAEAQITGIVLVFRDITERRLSERALIRAEKLASAGRLSAAIAHEINNPLEALQNLIYLTRLNEKDQENTKLLTQAELELGRISHIARQSLGFYRDNRAAEPFSLAAVIHDTVAFYAPRATIKNVAMETRIKSDTLLVGSPGEIRQVISNLLSNSLDALSAGGKVCIQLHKIRLNEAGGPDVYITVADNGSGIPDDHLETIFDPFFSTKGDIGTGLGLWVCKQLIEKHGGSIRVRSSPRPHRSWTVFRICLPVPSTEAASLARKS